MKQRPPKPIKSVTDAELRKAVMRQAEASSAFMRAYKTTPVIEEYARLRKAEQEVLALGNRLLAEKGKR